MSTPDLTLTAIWENTATAANHLVDAVRETREDPEQDVTKDLGNALLLLNKATSAIQQILSIRR